MTYNFDAIIDRRHTDSIKYDGMTEVFGSDDLTPLWVADMDFPVCAEITNALSRRLEHPVFGYVAVPQSFWQSIMDWLMRRHGFKVTRDELTFMPGVLKGVSYAIDFFTQKGDRILIQPPVYHPFKIIAEGNGRTVIENPLILDEASHTYRMNLEQLESLILEHKPRIMILCNPHNPGGVQWDDDTLRHVAQLCRQNGVMVISDEIHGDLMLCGRRHRPFASVSDDAAAISITLGAPSKTFNIPGLVSSWMVIKNPEIRDAFYRWLKVNEFDTPTQMAITATEAAYNRSEAWLDELLEYVQGNIRATEQFFAVHLPQVRPMRPEASFLVWLDCRALGLSQDELTGRLINKAHVALNTGTMFGAEGNGFMRLNVACPRSCLLEALSRISEALTSK